MDMRIRTRLLVSFAIVLALLVGVGGYSLNRMNLLADLTNDLYEHPFTVRKSIRDAYLNLMQMNRSLNRMVTSPDNTMVSADMQAINDSEKEFLKNMGIIRERFLGKQGDVDDVIKTYEEWKPLRDRVIALTAANQKGKAKELLSGAEAKLFTALDKETGDILSFSDRNASEFFKGAQSTARMSLILTALAIAAAAGIVVLVAVTLTRSIIRPLGTAMGVAARVADGDLTVTVPPVSGQDEMNLLLQTFGRMVENLRRQAMDIQEGVNVLAASAGEILASTTQVASSAAETASALNETTATVEEVKQTTQLAAQKARNVADTAQRSLQVSQGGRKAVESSVEGMNRIREQMATIAESIVNLSEQSHAIGEIIATVNDLAEQSNLLAVNASIEAAKAGEHGKGFAVVAHEVKSLADQSKQATAQVRALLNDIQKGTNAAVMATEQGSKAVEAGEKQAAEAGEAIQLLTESIAESANASAQITATSQQQLVGMDQVALAMENISEASALSVTSTKQAESSAQNLHELGQKLKRLVEQLKL
ncbi:methyl-accepting chemotaxis sensory transducer, class 40H [Geobacter metallireducens GS-15]|uniref:Methyl-accepting chemotaxis sensory transducer, class 40H n=2 Tax=Geobacter metallireducens TaxID=28232 RepID=Q39S47_GEOMG|nr:methyl-accepting chemotaxis sensory transducer, class 40H [Geobacter metallireducens GS-15]